MAHGMRRASKARRTFAALVDAALFRAHKKEVLRVAIEIHAAAPGQAYQRRLLLRARKSAHISHISINEARHE